MAKMDSIFESVDIYLKNQPEKVKVLLEKIRHTIKTTIPEAEETISYQMPCYKYHGVLVYFAGCKNHIGFYPTPSAITVFQNEISDYKSSKGAVQFPLNKPIPYDLISKMVLFKAEENTSKKK